MRPKHPFNQIVKSLHVAVADMIKDIGAKLRQGTGNGASDGDGDFRIGVPEIGRQLPRPVERRGEPGQDDQVRPYKPFRVEQSPVIDLVIHPNIGRSAR